MKLRLLALFFALSMIFSLVACNNVGGKNTATTDPNGQQLPAKAVKVDLDLTAEWDKLPGKENTLVQGCVVVRKAFLEENPQAVANFLTSYKASIDYLNQNAEAASALIATHGIFENANVAKVAIPKCNVKYIDGAEMKTAVSTYLAILNEINKASIGGALPQDDFYYVSNNTGENTPASDPVDVRVYTLNGTTGFGMAKLMDDAKNGRISTENYTFEVKTDAADVLAALTSGTADIAALPTNAASTVYNKTNGGVKILAINTLGCLFLLNTGSSTVTSIAQLGGKTVYAPAQNPTFILTYLCQQNGLTVVNEPPTNANEVYIDSTSYAKPANLRDAVASGAVELAVLPEPMVTIAVNKSKSNTSATAVKFEVLPQDDFYYVNN